MRGLLGHHGAGSYLHHDKDFASLVTGQHTPLIHSSVSSQMGIETPQPMTKSVTLTNLHRSVDRVTSPTTSLKLKRSRSATDFSSDHPKINALELYYAHFSGLQVKHDTKCNPFDIEAWRLSPQATGSSGMTVLEELIDAAMRICENSRASGQLQSSRSAVLLSSSGKVYVGCDVKLPTTNEAQSISAERAAFLSAIADGASQFEVS